ncbi:class I tRNA ligase family protein [Patescibacteria group bacterium]|nr:class I tRNA ligase family protein [Patescibacteria group bacterium]
MSQTPDTPEKSDAAKREEQILAFWKEHQIFEKSLEKEAPKGEFIFYDGPPFATGLPHSGSLLSSVSKDLIPRYKTMRGYKVRRRWGWDTHGLPIESLVEKKLGLKNKKEILAIGVEKFNETAREMVLEYVQDWKRYVERVGRWVDFDNSYKTMDTTFIESVWWGLKQIHEKGHLYEGRKVLMYCPHCETPLAKAEIAMDNTYKDITEEAVTVKFKVKNPEKHGLPENTFLLAWTTTPWTLPGNVGLAVGKEIIYSLAKQENGETIILAKDLLASYSLSDEDKIDSKVFPTLQGNELVGIEYEPLYEIPRVVAHEGKKWQVLSADFVHTEEGTGIVHTAVIYGEDDYTLGLKEGLPMVPILNPNATYNEDAPEFLHGKYIKKAEADIKADLESRGLLFEKAVHTHSYPHCYRCGTPLIYNAVSSWFINIQAVKEKLLAENETIRWIPEHLKHGRFRHLLETAPDWTISRNRFWASPLPIWKDVKGKVTVIGSLEELKSHVKKSGNTYFVMRHGTTDNNIKKLLSSVRDSTVGLNDEGRDEIKAAAEKLTSHGITQIYSSPFLRTRETAEIVAKEIGLSIESIVSDDRLSEFNFGEFNDGPLDKFFEYRDTHAYEEALPGGESDQEAKNRFGDFLYEIERTHSNETILIVTHGIGLEALGAIALGADKKESKRLLKTLFAERGEVRRLDFIPMPHNRNYELDYHLPYIDEIQLLDSEDEPLTRIPEVVDCWVESGSMPFAEYHYPFEHKEEFAKRTPGDFISEYIGQTRAWFYYMHVMSIELFGHTAFRNVLTTGTILAATGEKLSKSKKNYTDPYVLFDRFSADAFRYYLMSGVVMQAEDLVFKDEEIKESQNRIVNMLRNVLAFYILFKEDLTEGTVKDSENILDRWIRARVAEVTFQATENFDRYDVIHATRPMRDFIDDLSTWYVRRSRERIKGSDTADKQYALQTLRSVLIQFAKVIAPVMPFVAEELFQELRSETDSESVHLCTWPEAGLVDATLIEDMVHVRTLASEALMLRQKIGVKVRQPLAKLSIPGELSSELKEILKEEVNVREIETGASAMSLDAELTPELIREGDVREFMRTLADARKDKGLSPKDIVSLTMGTEGQSILDGVPLPGISQVLFGAVSDAAYTANLSFGSISFSIDAS